VSDRSTWRGIGVNAGARFVVMPVTAVLGIVATRLIIDSYGQVAYVQYGLIVGIAALLPFADLGLSAVVMNAVAESDDVHHDEALRGVLLTSFRLLLVSGAVIVLIAALLTQLRLWPHLLGQGLMPRGGPVAGACLALVGIALPFGVGQRVLTGLGKNHVTIILTGAQSPVVLLALGLVVTLGLPAGPLLALLPYLALLLLAVVLTVLAGRLVRPTLWGAARQVFRRVRGGRVSHVAWPMLVLMVATPLAMQTDRIVLSHVSTVPDLARYSLGAQMFLPIWSLTNAAGLALWPVFARARAKGGQDSPASFALVFGGLAAAAALTISFASPVLARLASGGQIRLDWELLLAFSALQILQATTYPFGIYLTDSAGLRFQVWMVLIMLPVNLGLSLVLGHVWGAVGPVIGSAVGVLIFQLLANWWYSARVIRRRAAQRVVDAAAGGDEVSSSTQVSAG
jgi:O-antigen/teichoic acid export membrane protein